MNLCTTMGVKLYVAITTFLRVLGTTLIIISRFLFRWGITIVVIYRLLFHFSFIKSLIRSFALRIIFMQCAPLCYCCHDNANISIVEIFLSPFSSSSYQLFCTFVDDLFYHCVILLLWFTICLFVYVELIFYVLYWYFICRNFDIIDLVYSMDVVYTITSVDTMLYILCFICFHFRCGRFIYSSVCYSLYLINIIELCFRIGITYI